MARVYVSIGSNVDREQNVVSCLKCMREKYGKLLVSTIYESKSVGFKGSNFYNLVAGFDTDDEVHIVVDSLRDIENRHGRDRNSKRFAPRTLDIDLLLYDDLVLHEKSIEIPRDDLTRYAFVLKPMAELAPSYEHPVLKRTVEDLWKEIEADPEDMWPVSLEKTQ